MFGQRGATAALALKEKGGQAILEMMDIVQRSGFCSHDGSNPDGGPGCFFQELGG